MRGSRLAVLIVVGLGMLGWSAREANAAIAASGNLSFGSVHRGTAAATQTVDITSDVGGSPGDVMVTIVETCPDVSVSPASGTVPRMGTGVLTLTVTYTASASTRGVMPTCTIDVNGSSSTSFTVDGTSIAPAISVTTPGSYGNVRWNTPDSVTQTVTITNAGNEAMASANLTTALTTGTHFTVSNRQGFPIAPAGTGTFDVTFNPTSAGPKTDTLTISLDNDYATDPSPTQSPAGTGVQSLLTFSSGATFNVGSAPTSGGTIDGTLTLQNLLPSGTATLNITSIAITGTHAADFEFTDHGCAGQTCSPPTNTSPTIASNATDPYVLRCTPSGAGTRTATLTVVSDDASSGGATSSKAVTLNCTGVPPTLTVNPTSVTFAGNTRVGSAATVQTITISNGTGAQALMYSRGHLVDGRVPAVVHGRRHGLPQRPDRRWRQRPDTGRLRTRAVGARTGMVTLTTNDPDPTDATKVINVSGTGAISSLSAAASLAFGTVDVAASGGVTQNLTLTNTGGMPLNISSMTITGDPTPNFTFAFTGCTTGQSCGPLSALAASPGPGNTLTITLRCDPTTIGAKTGTLNIVSDDPMSPRTVALTCTGATPDLQIAGPPLADFGSQRINTTSSTTRTFTISNPTGATTSGLTYNVTEASPHFSIACSAPGCSGTLAPGATAVTVTVSFRPTATGPLTGTINVASNDVSTASVDITVTGTGVEPLIALTAPAPATPPTVGGALTFPDTNVGATSATQTITIQNTGSMTLTISGVINTNTADFNLVGPTTTTIAPTGSASWTVACDPNTQGLRTGTIQIANDSNNDTSVDVALSCNACAATSSSPRRRRSPTPSRPTRSTSARRSSTSRR
jgi:hypothetical protein